MSTWRPAAPDRATSEATPIAASLAGEVRRLGGPDATLTTQVFGHWEEVVGPLVADHSRPRTLRDGVLTVEVDEPAWATQLRWLGAEVVARIGALVPGAGVEELVVRVAGERPRRPRPQERPSRAAQPGEDGSGTPPPPPPSRRRR